MIQQHNNIIYKTQIYNKKIQLWQKSNNYGFIINLFQYSSFLLSSFQFLSLHSQLQNLLFNLNSLQIKLIQLLKISKWDMFKKDISKMFILNDKIQINSLNYLLLQICSLVHFYMIYLLFFSLQTFFLIVKMQIKFMDQNEFLFLNKEQSIQIDDNIQKDEKIQTGQKNQKKLKKQKQKPKTKKKQMPAKQQKKQKFYCRFFMQGSCKHGLNCKFIHPVNVNSNQKNQTNVKNQESKGQNQKQTNSTSKTQQNSSQNIQLNDPNKKHARDLYYENMIDTMKITCYSCKKYQLPVYLSCGCCTICEQCAKNNKPCSKQKHHYDNQVYIK